MDATVVLFKDLSRNLPRKTNESNKSLSRDSRCLIRDSNSGAIDTNQDCTHWIVKYDNTLSVSTTLIPLPFKFFL